MTASASTTPASKIDAAHAAKVEAKNRVDEIKSLLLKMRASETNARAESARLRRQAEDTAARGESPVKIMEKFEQQTNLEKFFEQPRLRNDAFELGPAMVKFFEASVELERQILAGEQVRLAAHDQQLAQVLRMLVQVTGNPNVQIFGTDTTRSEADFIGARHRELIALQLIKVDNEIRQ